jgi:hypothetical protein
MSCKDTQNDRLLAYLKEHHYVTARYVMTKLHINNAWARLSELRKKHRIEDRFVKTKGGANIKQYWLVQGRKRAA